MRFEKCCVMCGGIFELEAFRIQCASRDLRKAICKICDDKKQRERYQKKKDLIKLQVLDWQKNHPHEFKKYKAKYYRKNHPLPPEKENPYDKDS